MFGPRPRRMNLYMNAVVAFDDGSYEIWQYPRVEKAGFVEKLWMERYRKFFNDHANWADGDIILPDLARFVARQNNRQSKAPEKVMLIRHYSWLPQPGSGAPEPAYDCELFYEYKVQPQDL